MSSSIGIYDPVAYIGAHIALTAVLIPALPVLGSLLARNVKPEGDPLRAGFKWLHAPICALFIASVLQVAYHAFLLGLYFSNSFPVPFAHLNRIASVSTLFSVVAEITLVFCVSRLVSAAAPRRVFEYLVLAALGLTAACEISVFGFGMWAASNRPFGRRFGLTQAFSTVRLVGSILNLLAAVGVFVQAMQARKAAVAAGRKLAVVAGLVLFILVWGFARTMVSLSGTIPGTRGLDITGVSIADVILSMWGAFVSMVMVYRLGKQREGGLWSDNRAKLERHSEEA